MGNDNTVRVKVTSIADNSGVKSARDEIDKLDGSHSKTAKSSAALSGALRTGVVAAAAAATAAGAAAAVIGFKFNSSVEQATAKINAFTKDQAKTAEILAHVKAEAAKTQFSFTDMAEAAAGLIPASKMSGVALNDLIKEAEILAALNPAEGLVGAAFSLKEALSGDFVSIVERFNLPRQRLNELKEQGVPAIEAIRTALQEMGIDYSLVAAQGETTAARWNQITDQFNMMAGVMMQPVFKWVSEQLSVLNEWLSRNKESLNQFATTAGQNVMGAIHAVIGAIQQWVAWMQPTFDYITRNKEALRTLSEGIKIASGIILGIALIISTALVGAFAAVIFIINQVQAVFNSLGNTVYNIITRVRGYFDAMTNSANSIPHRIAAGLAGLTNILTAPFQAALNVISGIISRISGAVASVSPGNIAKTIEKKLGIDIPGFASGGFTGQGGKHEVAGIVHKGEYVLPKEQVDQRTGQPKGMGTTFNNTYNIYNQVDIELAMKQQAWRFSTL